jgi:predicted RND superfamily exporter protein
MACAYLLFPAFLRAADPGPASTGGIRRRFEHMFTSRHPVVAVVFLAAALAPAVFISRIDTDPGLPRYFGRDSAVRNGIEAVDRAGGSSPLDLWVADAGGGDLVGDEALERLQALHDQLEAHPDVGSALSIALLMAENERPWYSFLIPWEKRLKALESADRGAIGRAFISADRRRGRYVLRMQEATRSRPRQEVIGEILEIVRQHGFEPAHTGGIYLLQGELSRLVEASVERSLGVLLIVFSVIAFLVVRSARAGVAMAVSLILMPFALFGLVGLFRMPIEFLSAPAANVALALGIDESIHLGHTAHRRLRKGAASAWDAWKAAIAELWYPILAAMLIVGAGFSLFLLSNFPPTRHLGLLVAVGVVIANLATLLVLPTLATRRPPDDSTGQ